MRLSEHTERAIEACYDAIFFPETWPVALDELARSLGTEGCLIHPHDPKRALSHIPLSSGLAEIAELWAKSPLEATNLYEVRAGRLVREGHKALVEEQISTEDERRSHPYYQEVARRADLEWWASACFSVESHFWCLPAFRGSRRGPFLAHEAEQLAAVGPSLGRLISFAEKFAEATAHTALATLSSRGCPAVLLDKHGAVIGRNREADALFGDAFFLLGRRLAARDDLSQRRLQHFVQAACRHDEQSQEPVLITRDSLPWLLVEAMPVRALRSDVFPGAVATLVFTDLSRPSVPDRELLRVVFGLTAAEARLAGIVADGTELKAAAAELGISHETARTHLKSIFAKSGTHRQAQLAALAGRLRGSRNVG